MIFDKLFILLEISKYLTSNFLNHRGEDENARERLESYRSEHERRNRAASISEASTLPFDQRSKNRTSSSSSQESAPSNRAPRGHSAHAQSGSPASSSRRNTVTSNADKTQISPNHEYEQRTARSLTGSLSSPGSANQRPSKNISTAQAIAVAASTASSPMFQQTGGPNSGPHSSSSTVINVTGEQRKHSTSSIKSAQGKPPPKFHEEDAMNIGGSKNTLVGNTHIIKVSGPVTNLDETVLSANVGMDGSLMASTISEHSTTSTTSATSSTAAAGIENREVSSSPVSSSNLSLALSYDIGYSTSPELKSLNTSILTNSTNENNIKKESENDTGINQEAHFKPTSSPKNSTNARINDSESIFSSSPPPPYSPSSSDPSISQIERLDKKQRRSENIKKESAISPSLNLSPSNENDTQTPPLSPGATSTQV